MRRMMMIKYIKAWYRTKFVEVDVITHLEELGRGERLPDSPRSAYSAGICYQMGISHLHVYFTTWDEFSGIREYPVPSPRKREDPERAYYRIGNLWKGPYGESRKRLCLHIASEMRKENDDD
jgi:hypothetical protein